MARHTAVTFDGVDYKIPTLTIDQLERLAEAQSGADVTQPAKAATAAFAMFKIITEDLDPKPEGKLRASMEEVTNAINKVMGGSGVTKTDGNPPQAA